MLGDYEQDAYNGSSLTMVIFILSTFAINVVMLNALIALMGDTFDRVQETSSSLLSPSSITYP